MANRGKKSQERRISRFVMLPDELLKSEAYRDLTHAAGKLLPFFLRKPKRPVNDPEFWNIEFQFSFPEALSLGFSKATFSRAYHDLAGKGFIEKSRQGGLRGHGKGYNLFRCSEAWRHYRTNQ